jgi:outer membrane protein TolC
MAGQVWRSSRCCGVGWTLILLMIAATPAFADETTVPNLEPEPVPLLVEEVLESALKSFPLIRAFALEEQVRMESARAAEGAFDTRLSVGGEVRPAGFYENWSGSGSLEQPSRYWGTRFYSKYRYGEGDFASYDGKQLTDAGGELSLGVEVPLLRGGRLDRARAAIRSKELDRSSYAPEFALEQIELVRSATFAYLDWVAAGQVADVVEELLSVAATRQSQLARRVDEGDEPEIFLRDNQRLVVERRSLLRGAERDFRQASLQLSMFLLDELGARIVADASRVPPTFPAENRIDPAQVERDLLRARTEHPRLQQLAVERKQLTLDVQLAENDILPALNLGLEGSRDVGSSRAGIDERGKRSSNSRSETEVGLRLRLEFPVQQRNARGRLGVARIRLDQLRRRTAYVEMEIETKARMALEALEAAFEQTRYARENVELAELLRSAESRKLNSGLSNLIDLNIREQQAASAAQSLVKAQQAYFRALADYRTRVALEG